MFGPEEVERAVEDAKRGRRQRKSRRKQSGSLAEGRGNTPGVHSKECTPDLYLSAGAFLCYDESNRLEFSQKTTELFRKSVVYMNKAERRYHCEKNCIGYSYFRFVLTGCASVETNEKTASIPTGTTISIDNPQVSATQGECEADFTAPLDYESLTEPPSLTASTLMYVDSVIASCGNYQWSHTLPDGYS